MDFREPINTGATCLHCGTGTVTLDLQKPNHARPGFTDVSFRCSVCPNMVTQTRDNRVISPT